LTYKYKKHFREKKKKRDWQERLHDKSIVDAYNKDHSKVIDFFFKKKVIDEESIAFVVLIWLIS